MSPTLHTSPAWAWSHEALALPDFVQAVRGLVQRTQGLPLSGWETSMRLSPQGHRHDRLLVGFDTAGVAPARLHALIDGLHLPHEMANEFLAALPQTVQIMLAVERSGHEVEWRAYQSLNPDCALASAGLAMRGMKWWPQRPTQDRQRITDYWRVPMSNDRLQHLLDTCPGVPDAAQPAYAVLSETLRMALRLQPSGLNPEFLLACEQAAPRVSCCLRLYESGLYGADLFALLDNLLAQWNWLPAQRRAALQVLAQRPLGWLAAGIDRHQQAFLTVYCEARREDASHALVNGNLHATA